MENAGGFTLIELTIVMAIIGILAAIAVPGFSNMIRKSKEGTTKGNLATLRSALSVYYADTEGVYPLDSLQSLIVDGKYLNAIPPANTVVWHKAGNVVATGTVVDDVGSADVAEWFYDNVQDDPLWGHVWVNCNHNDIKGVMWLTY